MTCDEFWGRYLAGDLDSAGQAHLAGCAACRSSLASLDDLRRTLADPTLWERPQTDLGERIVAEIGVDVSSSGGPRRIRRWWPVALASAVTAVAAVAVSLVVVTSRPDWEVALTATPVAADGEAVVSGWNTEAGTRMRIDVHGLEPAGSGAFYEVWLTAPDGRHVSAGTFADSGDVRLWAGVRRSQYPRIWITLESADADPGPSSVVMFDTDAESSQRDPATAPSLYSMGTAPERAA